MQLGPTIINTPKDDPTRFDPEWRHLIAMAWSSNPSAQWSNEYSEYRKDPWIVTHKRYLDILARVTKDRREPNISKELLAYKQALKWYKSRELSATRYRIEPLLLTAIGFDTIAKDVGGRDVEPEVFKTYERLFFSVRYEDGTLTESCQVRTYFAFPDGTEINDRSSQEKKWKAGGAHLGYGGLMVLWKWEGHGKREELDIGYILRDSWRLAQSALLYKMLCGGMSDFDFTNLVGKMVDSGRLAKDAAPQTSEQNEATALLMRLISQTAPKMKVAAAVDNHGKEAQLLAARIASQRLASGVGQQEQLRAADPDKFGNKVADLFKK